MDKIHPDARNYFDSLSHIPSIGYIRFINGRYNNLRSILERMCKELHEAVVTRRGCVEIDDYRNEIMNLFEDEYKTNDISQ